MPSRHALLLLGLVIAPARAIAQVSPMMVKDTSTAGRSKVMRTELAKLAEAQDAHFSHHKKYAANMTPTRNSTRATLVVQVTSASTTGWSAVATSLADTSLHCGIYAGSASPPNAAVTRPRTPGCWGGH